MQIINYDTLVILVEGVVLVGVLVVVLVVVIIIIVNLKKYHST